MFVPRRSLQPTPAGPLGAIKRVDGLPAEGTPPTHRHKSGGFDGRSRQATMKTDNSRSHEISRSGRQGVSGNAGSGGPEPQARGPKANEPTTSVSIEGRPAPPEGKPFVAHNRGVCEVGTRVLGLHGDPGRPYVLPTVEMRDLAGLGIQQEAREAGGVDPVATQGRRDEGVEWRHSTKEAS